MTIILTVIGHAIYRGYKAVDRACHAIYRGYDRALERLSPDYDIILFTVPRPLFLIIVALTIFTIMLLALLLALK